MRTLKTFALALIGLFTLLCSSVQAQDLNILNLDGLKMTSVNGGIELTWEYSQQHAEDSYFLIEKLDENWDYVIVDKVAVGQKEAYTVKDQTAVTGENYYRVTMHTGSESLLSELLIADHFKSDEKPFEFLFSDQLVTYAMSTIENPVNTGYLRGSQLALHTIKLARIKHLMFLDGDFQPTLKLLVASLDD